MDGSEINRSIHQERERSIYPFLPSLIYLANPMLHALVWGPIAQMRTHTKGLVMVEFSIVYIMLVVGGLFAAKVAMVMVESREVFTIAAGG